MEARRKYWEGDAQNILLAVSTKKCLWTIQREVIRWKQEVDREQSHHRWLVLQIFKEGLHSRTRQEWGVACPGKYCSQETNLKLSRTKLFTLVIYPLITQYHQESNWDRKVQSGFLCFFQCFTSTETGRNEAKPVTPAAMGVPPFHTPNSSTIIPCRHWLLALLFGTIQTKEKRHKCFPKVFITSVQ